MKLSQTLSLTGLILGALAAGSCKQAQPKPEERPEERPAELQLYDVFKAATEYKVLKSPEFSERAYETFQKDVENQVEQERQQGTPF